MSCPLCNPDTLPQLAQAGRLARRNLSAAVLRLYWLAGPQGLTAEEVARVLRAPHQSVSARVHDHARGGRIVLAGTTRATYASDGRRAAKVYRWAGEGDTAALDAAAGRAVDVNGEAVAE